MVALDADKQTNRDSIQRVWVERDLSVLTHFWTADGIDHAAAPEAGRGLEALHRYHAGFMDALAAFAGVEIEVIQQIAETGRVATHLRTHVEHRVDPFPVYHPRPCNTFALLLCFS